MHHVPPPDDMTGDWLFEVVASTEEDEVLTLRIGSADGVARGNAGHVLWGAAVHLGAGVTKVESW